MEFIFINLQNFFEWVVAYEVYIWLGVFGIICLYFMANLFCNPYHKYNYTLKKAMDYLIVCAATKGVANVHKIVLPKQIANQFDNYLRSDSRFPGEVITFSKLTFKNHGISLVVLAVTFAFVLLVTGVRYAYVPFVLFAFSCLSQCALIGVRAMRHKHAGKITAKATRLLDKAFGQSKVVQKQIEIADMCMDKEVDDVIAKINFFKANGINEDTAKEVASLLSNEKLNKIRTQEQQKRLNLALNGLLQVMSKKQQEKQVG